MHFSLDGAALGIPAARGQRLCVGGGGVLGRGSKVRGRRAASNSHRHKGVRASANSVNLLPQDLSLLGPPRSRPPDQREPRGPLSRRRGHMHEFQERAWWKGLRLGPAGETNGRHILSSE